MDTVACASLWLSPAFLLSRRCQILCVIPRIGFQKEINSISKKMKWMTPQRGKIILKKKCAKYQMLDIFLFKSSSLVESRLGVKYMSWFDTLNDICIVDNISIERRVAQAQEWGLDASSRPGESLLWFLLHSIPPCPSPCPIRGKK